jgi:hypothetical protein
VQRIHEFLLLAKNRSTSTGENFREIPQLTLFSAKLASCSSRSSNSSCSGQFNVNARITLRPKLPAGSKYVTATAQADGSGHPSSKQGSLKL